MPSANISGIVQKAMAYMDSPKMREKVKKHIDSVMIGIRVAPSGIHTPEEAAQKFIHVLENTINSSGLSENAKSAILHLDYGKPQILRDGSYQIRVFFTGDMTRDSLQPYKYGEIEDIAELFDTGVDHKMHAVSGSWHGEKVWSRTVIKGAGFMDQAVSDFNGNYAADYGVIDVQVERKA